MGYLPQTFSFVATDASTALVFTSQTNEQDGPVIGDVVVSGGGKLAILSLLRFLTRNKSPISSELVLVSEFPK